MTDNLTSKQRSYTMSRIKSSNTKPELVLKKILTKIGFVYQPPMYGKPDFADKKNKIVIFVDGCFWHKCPLHFISSKSNQKYWTEKINKNVLRDKKVSYTYKNRGWKVIRVWEHELKFR